MSGLAAKRSLTREQFWRMRPWDGVFTAGQWPKQAAGLTVWLRSVDSVKKTIAILIIHDRAVILIKHLSSCFYMSFVTLYASLRKAWHFWHSSLSEFKHVVDKVSAPSQLTPLQFWFYWINCNLAGSTVVWRVTVHACEILLWDIHRFR